MKCPVIFVSCAKNVTENQSLVLRLMAHDVKNYRRNWKHEIYITGANLFSNGSLFNDDVEIFCKDVQK